MMPSRLLVLSVLLVTPWCFGAVHESTQVYVFVALACALACMLISRHDAPSRLPLVLVALLAGIVLGLFQLWSMPGSVASLVSPGTVGFVDELVDDDDARRGGEGNSLPARYSISFRPAATRYDLSLLVLSIAGFVSGSGLFRSAPSRLVLCSAAAINTTLLAFFGLLQKLTWNGRMFWIGPLPSNDSAFATFVNRNNAGGYLNLGLACAIVLMLWLANRKTVEPSTGVLDPLPADDRLDSGRWRRAADFGALKFAVSAIVAILVGGILCTLSRGAGLALIGAAIVTALAVVFTGRKPLRVGGGLIALLSGVGLVGWVGLRETLIQRFGTLAEREQLISAGRVPNWLDALRSVADFWPAGSGLGTYRDIYLLYQERLDPSWYYYAENQYVQAVVEAGVPGLLLLLLAITAVVAAIWSLLRSSSDPLDYAFAVGGLYAVVSQVIHAFFDFGLYLPANMLLMAVLCGAVTQRAIDVTTPRGSIDRLGFRGGQKTQLVLVGSLLLGVVCGAWQVRVLAVTNAALAEADYSSMPGAASEADLRAAIARLQDRLPQSSDDAELHYELARAWIYLYRVQIFAELRRASPSSLSIDELWSLASSTELHRQAYQLLRAGDTTQLDELRSDPRVTAHLVPALRHLRQARCACPLLSKVHLRLARLAVLEPSSLGDEVHVRRARRLALSDPYTFVECGLLDLNAGRIDDACRSWRHALSLSEEYLEDVVAYAVPSMNIETVVDEVLPASPTLLLRLARQELPGLPASESRSHLLDRVQHLASADMREDRRHKWLASVHELRGDFSAALSEYENAVEMRPFDIALRHDYGRLLFQEGRLDEAHEQIRWCFRRRPESHELRRLLEELHRSRLSRPSKPVHHDKVHHDK